MSNLVNLSLDESKLELVLGFVDYLPDKSPQKLQSRDDHVKLIEAFGNKPEIIEESKSCIKKDRYISDAVKGAFSSPCLTSDAWRSTEG